jgi:hypothetical protein
MRRLDVRIFTNAQFRTVFGCPFCPFEALTLTAFFQHVAEKHPESSEE